MRINLHVWGRFACFTRPELRVERMSYPVPTPGAARGILEAIFYKPEFRWRIRSIAVLTPIRFIGLRRNEVKERAPATKTIASWMKGKPIQSIIADITKEISGSDEKGRTQRNTLALKDVSYLINADIELRDGTQGNMQKYFDCFRRRSKRGQCFNQPVFGCREFPAYFDWVDEPQEYFKKAGEVHPGKKQIGLMIYDVFDIDIVNDAYSKANISIFDAMLEDGILIIPDYSDTDKVKRVGREVTKHVA